jgi:hypothetical protein
MGCRDLPHFQHFFASKEAWEGLSDVFVGNASMKRNRYEALRNQSQGIIYVGW